MRKDSPVEQALREKLNRLFEEAHRSAGRFLPLAEVEAELKRRKKI